MTLKLYHLFCSHMCWTLRSKEEQSCQLISTWWLVGSGGGGRYPTELATPCIVRVCWEHLAEDRVKLIFNYHLWQSFICIPEVMGDIKSDWANVCVTTVESVVQSCGSKIAGASHGGNPRMHWRTPEVKWAVKLKKVNYKAWLA